MSFEPPLTTDIPPSVEILNIKKNVEQLQTMLDGVDITKLKLFIEVADAIGLWRCSQCKLSVDNVCTGWRISQEFANKIVAIAGEGAIVQRDNVYRLNLAKVPFLGVICPIYMPKT